MDDNTTDYLTTYRKFFEHFNANVKLNDPMPVTTSYQSIKEYEVVGQVFDWCHRYLIARDCPAALLVPLSRAVLEEVLAVCKSAPEQLGFYPHDNSFPALELSRGVITRLVTICQKYSDNAALSSLPPPGSESQSPVAAFAGDRNGRHHMEDLHTSIHDLHRLFNVADLGDAGFYAIYDGHQGVRASQYCVAHLHENLVNSPHYPSDPKAAFEDAFLTTDKNFLAKKLKGGCTAVCLLHQRKEKTAYLAWAGDSLAVLSRSGIPVPLVVTPHKPDAPEERRRIEEAGGVVINYHGVWRLSGALAVSRAIGDAVFKNIITAKPDVNKISITPRDHFIILGSDGLWDYVTYDTCVSIVYEHLGKGGDWSSASKALVERAAQSGSLDNISALVVLLRSADEIAMDVMAEGAPVWARPEDLGPETVVDDDLQLHATNDRSDGEWRTSKRRRRKNRNRPEPLGQWLQRQSFVETKAAPPEEVVPEEPLPEEENTSVIPDVEDVPQPDPIEEDPCPAEIEEFSQEENMTCADGVSESGDAQVVPDQSETEQESHEVAEASESDEEWNFIPGSDNKENCDPVHTEEEEPAPASETENAQERPVEEESHTVEEDDMESGLNPDAAEFVPFGGKGDAPSDFKHSSDEADSCTVPISAIPEGLDEVLASSPAKGSERSIDDVEVPSESEFDADIASRPADLDSDIRFGGLSGKDVAEVEEEDSNPFLANNDVDDVLSSPTTPPAGSVDFATGEHPAVAFQPMESTQPPLAFQPFDNSQPLISMSAEISSHFNFIDSHLAPDDDHVEQIRDGQPDFEGLVLSKNHFTHEAEENKIEEDARESETQGKADADFPADIMITSFHEGLAGGFDNPPPLSQKELLVGDEKHFMDKEENQRPLSDLDSSFEVVAPRTEEHEEIIAASDEDEVIDHSTEHTGLTNDLAELTLQERADEVPLVEHQNAFELKTDESHFTDSITNSSFNEQVQADIVESSTTHEEPEAFSQYIQESQRESVNPFHDESSSFNHEDFSRQNPFETELNNLTEVKNEEFIRESTLDSQEDMFTQDEPLKANDDHFCVSELAEEVENPATEIKEVEFNIPVDEPPQIVETSQIIESSLIEEPIENSHDIDFNVKSDHVTDFEEISASAVEFEEKPAIAVDEIITNAFETQITEEVPLVIESVTVPEPSAIESPIVAEETPLVEESVALETQQQPEVVEEVHEQILLESTPVEAEVVMTETVMPVCNGTSSHEDEVVVPEQVVEEASVAPVVAAAAAVGAVAAAAAVVGGAKIAGAKGKGDAKPAAASKTAAKPAAKTSTAKPATTASKKTTAAPSSKPAPKPSIGLTAAAKPKTAPAAKPAVAAKTAPATKAVPAKPAASAAKPAASAAAKTTAARPATAAAKTSTTAPKPAARPASAAAKPAAAKPAATAAKPSAPSARPSAAKTAAPAAKPAATATRTTAASAKPAATAAAKPASRPSAASTLAAKKPTAPAAKPALTKAPAAAKPAAAKPATTAAKSAVTKKPATSTTTNAAGKKPVPIKKNDLPKKVVNGGPHINLPEPVTSTNGHLESPAIATH